MRGGSRGPRPDVRRRLLGYWLRDSWERLGTLYGGDLWEDSDEARALRDECEELGEIPMGYGRVTRLPIQLSDEEARRQFGLARWRR